MSPIAGVKVTIQACLCPPLLVSKWPCRHVYVPHSWCQSDHPGMPMSPIAGVKVTIQACLCPIGVKVYAWSRFNNNRGQLSEYNRNVFLCHHLVLCFLDIHRNYMINFTTKCSSLVYMFNTYIFIARVAYSLSDICTACLFDNIATYRITYQKSGT